MVLQLNATGCNDMQSQMQQKTTVIIFHET